MSESWNFMYVAFSDWLPLIFFSNILFPLGNYIIMVNRKVKKIFLIYRSALLTKGSAITTSIFFSAWTANSAKRLLMTYSPGLTSGSIVMLDMMILLFPKVEWKLEEAQYLLTLLTGAEAKIKETKELYFNDQLNEAYHFHPI